MEFHCVFAPSFEQVKRKQPSVEPWKGLPSYENFGAKCHLLQVLGFRCSCCLTCLTPIPVKVSLKISSRTPLVESNSLTLCAQVWNVRLSVWFYPKSVEVEQFSSLTGGERCMKETCPACLHHQLEFLFFRASRTTTKTKLRVSENREHSWGFPLHQTDVKLLVF